MKNTGKAARTRTLAALASHCEQIVLNLQLPCGGWGYSRQWAVEPTCLALLALRLRPKAEGAKGLRFLESCQSPDGSWPGFEGDEEGSWATSLAVITLIRMGGDWPTIQRGCSGFLEFAGKSPIGWPSGVTGSSTTKCVSIRTSMAGPGLLALQAGLSPPPTA